MSHSISSILGALVLFACVAMHGVVAFAPTPSNAAANMHAGMSTMARTRPTRSSTRSSQALAMAGRMPYVPYYPNKDKGGKEYQWMDIYNALGRERTLFVGR
jgi:hypothetical protein